MGGFWLNRPNRILATGSWGDQTSPGGMVRGEEPIRFLRVGEEILLKRDFTRKHLDGPRSFRSPTKIWSSKESF